MSVPTYPSSTSRRSPLMQICHGAPGLLLLLGATRHHEQLSGHKTPEWDEAIQRCTERVWDEGLLSKGGGLCHGIAGNAWPWLILAADAFAQTSSTAADFVATNTEGKVAGDEFLSRALAFLLHAQETPPLTSESRYRVPDHPYSLLEGLAGTICAWSEACVLLTTRLRLMKMGEERSGGTADEWYADFVAGLLGFPGLGGCGACGWL